MASTDLVKAIAAFAGAIPQDLPEEERVKMLVACKEIADAIETPLETTGRLMLAGYEGIVLRLAVDLKLIDAAVAAGGPVTCKQLASECSADVALVKRIMRMLVAMKFFSEADDGRLFPHPRARTFVLGSPLREAVIHLATKFPTVACLPDFFAANGYKNPNDAYNGPFQYVYRTDKHYFDWLATRPELQRAFNVTMSVAGIQRGEQWFQIYPVLERLRVQNGSDILLVDVGGGVGHDVTNFHKAFPDIAGRLILQDTPGVVHQANAPPGIEIFAHDFFSPQPVPLRGAKAYYLRTVLHDWPDKRAATILARVRDAMSSGPVLLINENVLPESNAWLHQCKLDLNMMGSYSSLDRTEAQFKELLESVGFQLVGTWRPRDFVPGAGVLLEAVLKK